jgi:hypothetical protein
MYIKFAKSNIVLTSIILFVLCFYGIQYMHPAFLYNANGSIRQFGIGYKNKTIFPIWLLSICLGVLSYLAVLFFTIHLKIRRNF